MQIANFENTLVVRSRISSPGFRECKSTLTIWNSVSLTRIGEIDLLNQEVSHAWEDAAGKVFSEVNLKDDAVLKDVEIGDIVVAENTIVVHFMTKQRRETQHTETWIYKINTKDPKLEDLVLERVFREAIKCNVYGDGPLAVNSCYLVRVGQIGARRRDLADREGVCIIQAFNRMGPASSPSKDDGVKFDAEVQGGIWSKRKTGSYPKPTIRVREAKLCQKRESTLVALAIELEPEPVPRRRGSPPRIQLNFPYKVLVQVVNIETRQVVMQHNFGVADWGIGGRLQMCWSGSNLLVAAKLVVKEGQSRWWVDSDDEEEVEEEEISLFCWQEGVVDLLPIGISIKLDKDLYLIDMYADLEEITVITREDRGNKGDEKDHIFKFEPTYNIQ